MKRETDDIFGILNSKSSFFAKFTFWLKSVECPIMMVENKIPKKTITFLSTPWPSQSLGRGETDSLLCVCVGGGWTRICSFVFFSFSRFCPCFLHTLSLSCRRRFWGRCCKWALLRQKCPLNTWEFGYSLFDQFWELYIFKNQQRHIIE